MGIILGPNGPVLAAGAPVSTQAPNTLVLGFPQQLTLTNYHSTILTAPVVTIGFCFQQGDIPAGSRLKMVANSNGATIAMQEDAIASWGDGSRRFSALSFTSSDTFAANGSNTYTLSVEAAAPNNTPAFTLAQFLANHDPKILFTGFDCGSNTLQCSLAQITSAFTQSPWEGNFALASAASSSSNAVTLVSAANVSKGMLVTGLGVPANTLVSAVSGNNVTLSKNLTAGIGAGVPLHFGSPLGGWEQICSGPNCQEWHAWCYLYAVSGPNAGAYHTQVRCDIYVRAWAATGPFEIYGQLRVPNVYGNMPGASIGPTAVTGKRFCCNATVQDGSTVLYYFGGVNDPRTFQVSASAFVTNSNPAIVFGTNPPNWMHLNSGGCTPVTFVPTSGSTLPGGLTSTTECWLQRAGTPTSPNIFSWRLPNQYEYGNNSAGYSQYRGDSPTITIGTAYFNGDYTNSTNNATYCNTGGAGYATLVPTGPGPVTDGAINWVLLSAYVPTGTAGTGTVNVCPLLTVHPVCGTILATASCEPIWSNTSSPRPYLMPSYALNYYLTQTKAVLPYDQTKTLYARTDTNISAGNVIYNTFTEYSPSQTMGWVSTTSANPQRFNITATGDAPGDERIGYIPNANSNDTMLQNDPLTRLVAFSIALGFADYPAQLSNEVSGQPFICDAGPWGNPSAAPYPGLGPVDVVTSTTSAVSLQVPPTPATFPYILSPDWSGYSLRYGGPIDPQHICNPFYTCYLRTGHRIYFDNQMRVATNLILANGVRSTTVGKTTFYGPIPDDPSNIVRSLAWIIKIVGQVNYSTPDNHICYQWINNYLTTSAQYYENYYVQGNILSKDDQGVPRPLPNAAKLGLMGLAQNNINETDYQNSFIGISFAMEAWRDPSYGGKRPQWLEFLSNYWVRYVINVYDATQGGGLYFSTNGDKSVAPPLTTYTINTTSASAVATSSTFTVSVTNASGLVQYAFLSYLGTAGAIGYSQITGITGNVLTCTPAIPSNVGSIASGTALTFYNAQEPSLVYTTPAQLWADYYNASAATTTSPTGYVASPNTPGFQGPAVYEQTSTYPYDVTGYATIRATSLACAAWAGVPGAQAAFNTWKTAATTSGYSGITWAQTNNSSYDLGQPRNYTCWMVASPANGIA